MTGGDSSDRGQRARALMDLGRYAQARPMLAEALADEPADASTWSALARCCYRLGDHTAALDAAGRSLAHNPSLVPAWRWRAIALTDLKRWDEARSAALEAVRLDPQHWFGYVILARVLVGNLKGHFDEAGARQAALKARELAPQEAESHFYVGRVAERAGRQLEAESSYRRALALDPEHRAAQNQLALIMLTRGDNRAAAQGFAAVAAADQGASGLGEHNLRVVAVRLIARARWVSVGALVLVVVGVELAPAAGWGVRGALLAAFVAGWAVWGLWASRQVPARLRTPLLRSVRRSGYVLLVLLGIAAFTLAAAVLALVPPLDPYFAEVLLVAVVVQLGSLRAAQLVVRRAKARLH